MATVEKDAVFYKKLLRGLIFQTMVTMRETEYKIVCRAKDRELVSAVMADAAEEFTKKTGIKVSSVSLEDSNSLPNTAAGGVVLTSLGGRVVCTNTLETRLQIAVEKRLPDIRKILFPLPLRKTPLATAVAP